ncbi:MAG TPA: hypothetical protein VN249_10135 [Prolixibacteraceae bacterium]|nr:hypothetical protein [Prolixibacteraceae bacterium]
MKNFNGYCKWSFITTVVLLLCSFQVGHAAGVVPEISIITDQSPGVMVQHGIVKLTDALTAKKISFEKVASLQKARGKLVVVAGLSNGDGTASELLKSGNQSVPKVAEALTIWKTSREKKPVWVISGSDDRGLMYALLDVADRIGWSTDPKSPMSEVKEITEKPDVPERAVSLYTMNRAYWESRFYDEAYWTRYLDMLAQNRFNSMVVIFGYENGGFLAPCYPYFFDTEEFPEVKMIGITPQEQKRNLDALNRLISMAHARGVKFSVGIWDHIYRGGVQSGGIAEMRNVPLAPVHGLVWGVNDANLVTYNKAALAKFVQLVPGLDGIQFRMHNESGLKKSEQDVFWSDVFRMLKVTVPGLRLDLRAKELPESVIQSAIDMGINFRITTKYWMEQMGMPWHPTQINPEKSERRHSYAALLHYPQMYKMHWRLWNGGTSRILLWGDPEYVRRCAGSSHLYDGDGYEVNEPLATKMEAQPHDAKPFDLLNPSFRYYDYEFERYWHFFQVFGRIGYNPQASPEIWQKEFNRRFGSKAAPFIEKALHQASWILPRIIASCYPYSGFPTTRGWAEKQRLGDLPAYARNAGSDLRQFSNFDEEALLLIEGTETAKLLPSMNSLWFKQTSEEINSLITEAEKALGNQHNIEFNSTVTDLKILSGLALYHSRRIPAAVSYNLFERTKDVLALDDAIAYERDAIDAWRQIVNAAGDVYTPDIMMGVRNADLCGHWKDELLALEKGLKNLEQKRAEFKAEGKGKLAPKYKAAANPDNNHLFQIIHAPVTTAEAGKPITLSIKVHATSGVKWVRLLYREVNQEMEYRVLQMLPSGGEDNYRAIIPADQVNAKWDLMYLVEVMDKNGKGKIYPDFNLETPYRIIRLAR